MTTRRHTIEIETITFIAIGVCMGIFFAWRERQNSQPPFHLVVPIASKDTTQVTITPSVSPTPKIDITSQTSSDGSKKLILKATLNADGTKLYAFSVTDKTSAKEQSVFSKTLDGTQSMSIPFNTWSSNNQYFFIQENTKSGNNVYVFNASGAAFADGEAFLDLTNVFKQRVTGNTFDEATGWASENLIIINTLTADNTKGPSYWFEVPSKGITQLSTQF